MFRAIGMCWPRARFALATFHFFIGAEHQRPTGQGFLPCAPTPLFPQTIFRVSRGRALSIAHRSVRQASACNSHRSSTRHRRRNSRRIAGRGRRPGFADYMPTVKSLRMTWGYHCVVSTVSSSPSIIEILRLVDQDHCRIPTASTVDEFTAWNV